MKMNKYVIALTLSGFAMTANAGQLTVSGANPVSVANCGVLGEAVTINLSNNVLGGYTCNTGTNNATVVTCSTKGKVTTNVAKFYKGSSFGGAVAATTGSTTCTAPAAETLSQASGS